MPKFLITCYFDINQLEKISKLKVNHRLYISTQINNIIYGGTFKEENSQPKGIIIIAHFENSYLADCFVKNDPYYLGYDHYQIAEFEQKIPVTLEK
jgi:uncharacterized protein YciI